MRKSGLSKDLLGESRSSDAPAYDDYCDGEAADVGYGTQSSTSSDSELWRQKFQVPPGCGRRPSPMAGRAASRMAASVRSAESGGCDSVMSLASTASSCSRGGDDDGSCSSDSLAGSFPMRRPLRGRYTARDLCRDCGHQQSVLCSCNENGYAELPSDEADPGAVYRSRMRNGVIATPLASVVGERRSSSPLLVRRHVQQSDQVFVGREWAFDKVAQVLQQVSKCRGVAVTGATGTGKSAFIEQIYQISPLGDGRGSTIQNQDVLLCLRRTIENGRMSYSNSPTNSPAGTLVRAAATQERGGGALSCVDSVGGATPPHSSLRYIASLVVACHVCSSDDAGTCSPGELVRSIASQMMRSQRLGTAYCLALRDGEFSKPRMSFLSACECARDPLWALQRAVFEPLAALREQGAIDSNDLIVLVDGLSDAELHRPDSGADGVASFLGKALLKCPPFIRFIVTARSSMVDIVEPLSFFTISFDAPVRQDIAPVPAEPEQERCRHAFTSTESVCQDIMEYITYRMCTSGPLKANICVGSSAGDGSSFQTKACQHFQALSGGSFLYCKLVLDLIEQGQLVLKTANFKIVPVNLSEVFLLSMNLKFPGLRAFERAQPLLNVCLASLRPLTAICLYDRINAGYVDTCVPWDDFQQRLSTLSGMLVEAGRDEERGTLSFFHPAFRDWLTRREDGQSTKFLCDIKAGHACIALQLSRTEKPVSEASLVELGHHVLKAHFYKSSHPGLSKPQEAIGQPRALLAGELQACWLAMVASDPTSGLSCAANLFSPNVNVSRLLLLSGGDANGRTDFYGKAPLLCVAAREGFTDVVNVLLEFGANVDGVSADGQTPLCFAASRGHLNVAKSLKDHGAQVAYLDNAGRCPLIHAALHGHLEMVKFLVNCLRAAVQPHQLHDMIVSAVVSGSTRGHCEVIDFLLDILSEIGVGDCDSLDGSSGETALTAACLYGRRSAVELLLGRGSSACKPNGKSFTPLLCAAKSGHCSVAEAVLGCAPEALCDADKHGRTVLAVAAAEGHVEFVNLLLDKGVPVDTEDKEGLSALSWACVKGRARVARLLLDQQAKLEHVDKSGRGPLDLAVISGDAELVHLLIERGASTERADASGVRPLDRAVELRHLAAARCLLRKGARLTQATWTAASGDAGALRLLLGKLLDDGSTLYRKGRVKEAAARYQYALKHCPALDCASAASLQQSSSAAKPVDNQGGIRADDFAEVWHCAMINLAKCCRKLGDTGMAVELATAALQQQQHSPRNSDAMYEAYCCRARARRDSGHYELALQDVAAAEKFLQPGTRGLRSLAARIREESKQQSCLAEAAAVIGGSNSSLDDADGEAESSEVIRRHGNVDDESIARRAVPSVVISAAPLVCRRAEETAL